MSNLWQSLEVLADGNHVGAEWAKWSGDHFSLLRTHFLRDTEKRAGFVPCPHGCGCDHRIHRRANGALVGVCQCEPWNCEDVAVTPAEATLLALNIAKLGRTLSQVFECDRRETRLPLPLTWQIGAKFANGVPVFLTIQNERDSFRRVVAELTARQRDRFILLAPTSRLLDATSKELLAGARAGFFDLESQLVLLPTGKLHPKIRPGELFQPFAPDAAEPAPETVFAQIFALIEKMDADENIKDPSVMRVFRYYCGRGLSAEAVADKCGCVKSTVLKRLDKIRQVTGKDPQELRAYSPFFKKVDDAVADSRAEHIHRKSLVHDVEESDDESE